MNIKHRILLGCAASLFVSASASAAILSGYAGQPDPMSDDGVWDQTTGLGLVASNNALHYFNVPIPLIVTGMSTTLTVQWDHRNGPLTFGAAAGRVITFNADGTASTVGSFDSTVGLP